MVKDADYFISAVSHTDKYKTRIAYVRRHVVFDDNRFNSNQFENIPRLTVVNDLKSHTYMTVYWTNTGWMRGAQVHHVHEYGKDFLSTNPNETTRDNLDKLPTF